MQAGAVREARFGWFIFACFALGLLYVAAGYALPYFAPSSPYGYAIAYSVNPSSVLVDRIPHDCEWFSAPLGDKHCHYEAKVIRSITVDASEVQPVPQPIDYNALAKRAGAISSTPAPQGLPPDAVPVFQQPAPPPPPAGYDIDVLVHVLWSKIDD
ncbi:MAG: hypothetical protein WBY44_37370 [Bryobacteraceae bacterium]